MTGCLPVYLRGNICCITVGHAGQKRSCGCRSKKLGGSIGFIGLPLSRYVNIRVKEATLEQLEIQGWTQSINTNALSFSHAHFKVQMTNIKSIKHHIQYIYIWTTAVLSACLKQTGQTRPAALLMQSTGKQQESSQTTLRSIHHSNLSFPSSTKAGDFIYCDHRSQVSTRLLCGLPRSSLPRQLGILKQS